eukprot:13531080-Alexandrium_andersonii.AAC.1
MASGRAPCGGSASRAMAPSKPLERRGSGTAPLSASRRAAKFLAMTDCGARLLQLRQLKRELQ